MVPFPQKRESAAPLSQPACHFEAEGILHLDATRAMVLILGAVLPQFSGAAIAFNIHPVFTICLSASGISSLFYIFTFLKKQHCVVRVYSNEIVILSPKGPIHIERGGIRGCRLTKTGNRVEIATEGEVRALETKNPMDLAEAIKRIL